MVSVGAQAEAALGLQGQTPTQSQEQPSPMAIVPGTGLRMSIKLFLSTKAGHWIGERVKVDLRQARQTLVSQTYLHFRDQAMTAIHAAALQLHGPDMIEEIVVRPWYDRPDEEPLEIAPMITPYTCFISFGPSLNNDLDDCLHLAVRRHPGRELQAIHSEHHPSTYARAILSIPGCPIPSLAQTEPELSLVC